MPSSRISDGDIESSSSQQVHWWSSIYSYFTSENGLRAPICLPDTVFLAETGRVLSWYRSNGNGQVGKVPINTHSLETLKVHFCNNSPLGDSNPYGYVALARYDMHRAGLLTRRDLIELVASLRERQREPGGEEMAGRDRAHEDKENGEDSDTEQPPKLRPLVPMMLQLYLPPLNDDRFISTYSVHQEGARFITFNRKYSRRYRHVNHRCEHKDSDPLNLYDPEANGEELAPWAERLAKEEQAEVEEFGTSNPIELSTPGRSERRRTADQPPRPPMLQTATSMMAGNLSPRPPRTDSRGDSTRGGPAASGRKMQGGSPSTPRSCPVSPRLSSDQTVKQRGEIRRISKALVDFICSAHAMRVVAMTLEVACSLQGKVQLLAVHSMQLVKVAPNVTSIGGSTSAAVHALIQPNSPRAPKAMDSPRPLELYTEHQATGINGPAALNLKPETPGRATGTLIYEQMEGEMEFPYNLGSIATPLFPPASPRAMSSRAAQQNGRMAAPHSPRNPAFPHLCNEIEALKEQLSQAHDAMANAELSLQEERQTNRLLKKQHKEFSKRLTNEVLAGQDERRLLLYQIEELKEQLQHSIETEADLRTEISMHQDRRGLESDAAMMQMVEYRQRMEQWDKMEKDLKKDNHQTVQRLDEVTTLLTHTQAQHSASERQVAILQGVVNDLETEVKSLQKYANMAMDHLSRKPAGGGGKSRRTLDASTQGTLDGLHHSMDLADVITPHDLEDKEKVLDQIFGTLKQNMSTLYKVFVRYCTIGRSNVPKDVKMSLMQFRRLAAETSVLKYHRADQQVDEDASTVLQKVDQIYSKITRPDPKRPSTNAKPSEYILSAFSHKEERVENTSGLGPATFQHFCAGLVRLAAIRYTTDEDGDLLYMYSNSKTRKQYDLPQVMTGVFGLSIWQSFLYYLYTEVFAVQDEKRRRVSLVPFSHEIKTLSQFKRVLTETVEVDPLPSDT
ncbi:hypothetical protein CYMTET_23187 [Cymbomonas tetramitiformis]|uniref:Uncharacterized protein n=1 Tax=Cymbomonas tetramitiformis TaxID=36881 RepID=A0AAE0FYF0_9CHLO|nr:hypothetical protein CYMTET_23187 [Cymbomonas tetramitiformis]